MASTPQFIATVRTPVASLANADGTTFKSMFAASSSGSRVDTLSVINTDTSNAYTVQVAVQISGIDYELGEVLVPAGSGMNGTAKSVAVLNPTDMPALAYTESGSLFLASGAVLRVRSKTAVSGVNQLRFVGVAGDY